MRFGLVFTVLLMAASTSGFAADDSALTKAGKVIFTQRCHICHAEEADKKTYGPPLVGVIGRKAGSYEGYSYSPALTKSGFVWTDEALKAWMANNTEFMPGTKMRHRRCDR